MTPGAGKLAPGVKQYLRLGNWIFEVEPEPTVIEIECLVKKATAGEEFRKLGGHSAGT